MKTKGLKYWKGKAWDLFSKYIRMRDCLKTTGTTERGRCVTCNREYPYKQLQAGHFVPGRGNAVLFDERGVHAQCYGCNVGKKGNWPNYLDYMKSNYDPETINELLSERNEIKKVTPLYYQDLIAELKQKIQVLEGVTP